MPRPGTHAPGHTYIAEKAVFIAGLWKSTRLNAWLSRLLLSPSTRSRDRILAVPSGERIHLLAKARGSVSLVNIAGHELQCARGTIWVTQEGDLDDITLTAGQSARIDRHGTTLVAALTEAGFLLVKDTSELAYLRMLRDLLESAIPSIAFVPRSSPRSLS